MNKPKQMKKIKKIEEIEKIENLRTWGSEGINYRFKDGDGYTNFDFEDKYNDTLDKLNEIIKTVNLLSEAIKK